MLNISMDFRASLGYHAAVVVEATLDAKQCCCYCFCLRHLQHVRDYARNKCQASADSTASTTWSSELATLLPNWRTLPMSSTLKKGNICWQKGPTPLMRCGEPKPWWFSCSRNGPNKNAVKTTSLQNTAITAKM